MPKPTVFMFPNGMIAVTDEKGEQIVELQRDGIIGMIAKKMVAMGFDPTSFDWQLSTGEHAEVFKCEDGSFNWRTYR